MCRGSHKDFLHYPSSAAVSLAGVTFLRPEQAWIPRLKSCGLKKISFWRKEESACSAADLGSIPGLGRSPGEGNGNPLQYSCLENLMTEEPGGLQSMGSQRVGHNWVSNTSLHTSERKWDVPAGGTFLIYTTGSALDGNTLFCCKGSFQGPSLF